MQGDECTNIHKIGILAPSGWYFYSLECTDDIPSLVNLKMVFL
jgi:hypothetical protein